VLAVSDPWFYGLDESVHLSRVFARLGAAALLGGLVGLERQEEGKAAGLRTHMLVALGAALFVLVPLEAGVTTEATTRIIQGLTTGIGFIGAGVILKLTQERRIQGITSAATLWTTAAIGMAVGLGWLWPALAAVVIAWIVLFVLGVLEYHFPRWWKK
jgi:putative Mg2+ transporter-C (MgtC) family protein